MNKEQVKGRVGEAKGKVKELTGNILNDDEMELEGNVEKKLVKSKRALVNLRTKLNKANKTCRAAQSFPD
ncbi:MAG: CsbD family protein [Methylococcales bacterium]|nr:CsbD family protein [Methylococcales bacterium]